MVITMGHRKAVRAIWASTRVQHCLVYVKRQVVRKTTMNPKLDYGHKLLDLAKRLLPRGGQQAMQHAAPYGSGSFGSSP